MPILQQFITFIQLKEAELLSCRPHQILLSLTLQHLSTTFWTMLSLPLLVSCGSIATFVAGLAFEEVYSEEPFQIILSTFDQLENSIIK